jgi:hypothetical protein
MAAQRKTSKSKGGVTITRGWLWVIAVVFVLMVYRCGVSKGRAGALPVEADRIEVVARG